MKVDLFKLKIQILKFLAVDKKIKKIYTTYLKDKINPILLLWLIKHHAQLKDSQIARVSWYNCKLCNIL